MRPAAGGSATPPQGVASRGCDRPRWQRASGRRDSARQAAMEPSHRRIVAEEWADNHVPPRAVMARGAATRRVNGSTEENRCCADASPQAPPTTIPVIPQLRVRAPGVDVLSSPAAATVCTSPRWAGCTAPAGRASPAAGVLCSAPYGARPPSSRGRVPAERPRPAASNAVGQVHLSRG